MNILFVCTGNTCRSPMAEGYLKSKNINGLCVESRGLGADGSPVSKNSALAMAETGIDIEKHISRLLTAEDIAWADKIICLSPSHKAILESVMGESSKLSVLGNGIPDPFGGDINAYRQCRDEIISAIDLCLEKGEFADFTVVVACREHIKQIAQLEIICFSQPWSEECLLEAYSRGTKLFVAVKGDEVLGYAGISTVLDEGYITNIAVFPQHRKKGVATALLNKIFDLAKEQVLAFVSLEVRESNSTAISLYEKSGFVTEGKRRDFYRDPKEDACIMTKRF